MTSQFAITHPLFTMFARRGPAGRLRFIALGLGLCLSAGPMGCGSESGSAPGGSLDVAGSSDETGGADEGVTGDAGDAATGQDGTSEGTSGGETDGSGGIDPSDPPALRIFSIEAVDGAVHVGAFVDADTHALVPEAETIWVRAPEAPNLPSGMVVELRDATGEAIFRNELTVHPDAEKVIGIQVDFAAYDMREGPKEIGFPTNCTFPPCPGEPTQPGDPGYPGYPGYPMPDAAGSTAEVYGGILLRQRFAHRGMDVKYLQNEAGEILDVETSFVGAAPEVADLERVSVVEAALRDGFVLTHAIRDVDTGMTAATKWPLLCKTAQTIAIGGVWIGGAECCVTSGLFACVLCGTAASDLHDEINEWDCD